MPPWLHPPMSLRNRPRTLFRNAKSGTLHIDFQTTKMRTATFKHCNKKFQIYDASTCTAAGGIVCAVDGTTSKPTSAPTTLKPTISTDAPTQGQTKHPTIIGEDQCYQLCLDMNEDQPAWCNEEDCRTATCVTPTARACSQNGKVTCEAYGGQICYNSLEVITEAPTNPIIRAQGSCLQYCNSKGGECSLCALSTCFSTQLNLCLPGSTDEYECAASNGVVCSVLTQAPTSLAPTAIPVTESPTILDQTAAPTTAAPTLIPCSQLCTGILCFPSCDGDPTEQLCLKDGRACNDVVPTLCTGSTLQLCSAGFEAPVTEAPTQHPTEVPTLSPISPTETPTIYDPAVPTMKPTNPTEKPTIAPTTAAPTEPVIIECAGSERCNEGFFRPFGTACDVPCGSCPAGTYQPDKGKSTCILCGSGNYICTEGAKARTKIAETNDIGESVCSYRTSEIPKCKKTDNALLG